MKKQYIVLKKKYNVYLKEWNEQMTIFIYPSIIILDLKN